MEHLKVKDHYEGVVKHLKFFYNMWEDYRRLKELVQQLYKQVADLKEDLNNVEDEEEDDEEDDRGF
jgi:hypothetical protein